MSKVRKKTVYEIFREGTVVDEALKRGVRNALRIHKLLKNPIATWRDGRVVWIPPEEIPVSETDEENSTPQLPLP